MNVRRNHENGRRLHNRQIPHNGFSFFGMSNAVRRGLIADQRGAVMIRGIYSAATGLEAFSLLQDTVAENLANSTTPGYRRRGVAFESYEQAALAVDRPELNEGDVFGTVPSAIYNSFEEGPVVNTGNPLDMVLKGNPNAFFGLAGPNGPLFTRSGVFTINGEGLLQTPNGLPVRGQGGATITIPPGTAQIGLDENGGILANGVIVGTLELNVFQNPNVLQRVGPSLFQGPAPVPAVPGTVQVVQGYRENSNVQPVTEMVSMIFAMRLYESAQRALRSLAEAIQQHTRPER